MAPQDGRDTDVALLGELLNAGAITAEDFRRLALAVSSPPTESGAERQSSSRFAQSAGSITLGVLAGSLAADLVASALSEPDPIDLEYTSVSETTFTDTGFITHTTESYGSSDESDSSTVDVSLWNDDDDYVDDVGRDEGFEGIDV